MEFINATKVSPLVSKVQVKVCYVGQEANRNGTVITKETATKLARGLPGCPIVGYYNEDKQDFESHSKEVVIEGGKYRLVDMTKPYGFVDVGARVWFQKFSDDDGVEREYLCTEGYLWTGVYQESKRVVEKGNNQSMELNEEYEKGFWANDNNSGKRIFIINDGLIEKLCILGSNVEPCFQGAQIKSFSLTSPEFTEFKNTMFSMINELKDTLSKGGSERPMENENMNPISEEEVVPTDFAKKDEEKEQEQDKKTEGAQEEKPAEKGSKEEKPEDKEDEKKKEKKYELSEIAEYVALQLQYNELQNKYSALEAEHNALVEEANELRTFKLAANRKEKEAMVNSFYMLSDEDKKDVVAHLDTYSLDDIEAKLSIICVRNKVNFNLDDSKEETEKPTQQYMLDLGQEQIGATDNSVPAWVQAVRAKG